MKSLMALVIILATQLAHANMGETRSIRYSVGQYEEWPQCEPHEPCVQKFTLQEAKDELMADIIDACGVNPRHVEWEEIVMNPHSYGRQAFYVKGHFNCL